MVQRALRVNFLFIRADIGSLSFRDCIIPWEAETYLSDSGRRLLTARSVTSPKHLELYLATLTSGT